MNRLILITLLFSNILFVGCAQDNSKYDLTSPCVANQSGLYLNQPCERRLPIENINNLSTIAVL